MMKSYNINFLIKPSYVWLRSKGLIPAFKQEKKSYLLESTYFSFTEYQLILNSIHMLGLEPKFKFSHYSIDQILLIFNRCAPEVCAGSAVWGGVGKLMTPVFLWPQNPRGPLSVTFSFSPRVNLFSYSFTASSLLVILLFF